MPLVACPGCGGAVDEVEAVEQFIEEIPPIRPRVTRLVTYRGRCAGCGEVHSSHPLQTSAATGAAATQLGPNARSWAIALNKQFGLTTRKTCRVLRVCGLSLSPGGLAQAAQRTAEKVLPSFDALVQEARAAAAVYVDETSWYVGGPGHWLWTFTTADATVYHVDHNRGRQVVLDLLGEDFQGC
ncbi:MAG: transposase [Isosphaeraceae bacterium]